MSPDASLQPTDGLRSSEEYTSSRAGRRAFLTAEWRHLVMLNYEVPAALLEQLIPRGTVLDLWQDRAVVSVVGFRFLRTRLLGIPVPFHRNFDEVNLRFYVRRELPTGEVRRGVVFIRELVPRRIVPPGSIYRRSIYRRSRGAAGGAALPR